MRWRLLLGVCIVLGCGAPASETNAEHPREPSEPSLQRGKATWYGGRFHGRKTASGERFDKNAMTAAHRKLPFGTRVRVTNLANGRTAIVRINDRGPFSKGRIIDLSEAAARKVRMIRRGVVPVTLEVLSRP